MAETFYVGEAGRSLPLYTGISWAGATTKTVKVIRPDATTLTFSGSDVHVDDAATGVIHVDVTAALLTIPGEYLVQAKCITASTSILSPVTVFRVEAVL
jgi:hypothetical protein